ncbi:MAG TPA: carbonic anhydrase [Acidobacteriota bacterium]|nr:carbonic anhydrase [Acidobacteriota bacterium]
MSPTLLQQVREANKKFLAGTPQLLDSSGAPFIVVTCMDPRLTGVIEAALGLPPHRAIVIRTAGNSVSDANTDVLRSVAAAIFLKGGKEIFIAGHTDCALSKFSAAAAIESFRNAGIPRSAFGDADLRNWFGAFTDVKANVISAVEYLRKSVLVPKDVKVHGLIIRIESGEAEVIADGDVAPAEVAPTQVKHEEVAAPPPIAAATAAAAPSAPAPAPASLVQKGVKGPVVIPTSEKTPGPIKPPESMLDAAMIVRDFIYHERRNAQFERTLAKINNLLKTERDPVRLVTELDAVAHSYKAKYPKLPGALEYLKNSLQGKGATGFGFRELMKRMLE